MSNLAVHAAFTQTQRLRRHQFKRVLRRTEVRVGDSHSVQRLSLSSAGYLYKREGAGDRQQASAGTEERSLRVTPDQLVINPMWLTGGSIAVSKLHGAVSPDYRVFEASLDQLDPRYLHHLLRSQPYRDQYNLFVRANTTFDRRIQQDDLDQLPLWLPEVVEQRRIADFLDDRVARIDQIITARRTQIAAVREHWALELEWVLGSISETTRASRVLRVLPGFAFPSEAYSEDPSDRRLLRGVNVAVGSTRWDEVVYWPEDRVDEVGEFVLGAGDLVLGMDRPWIGDGLRIARVTEDDGSPLLLQRVAKLASDVLDSEYLFWAYQSRRFRDQVELDLTGLSVPHLSGDQIGSFDIPVCDAHRQAAVVRALNAGTESVSRLINAIGASIGRLDEYKQSLITAAVTGEIDVTAAGGGTPG